MKPSELIESLKLLVGIQRPAFITGDAGVGKSRIVRQVAEGLDLDLIDVRAVLLDPVDIRGLPHVNGDGRAHWAIPDFLPREGNGLLFLDELNRAPQLVQNACLQLALERQVGEYKLPDGWSVVAAGNPDTHRGVTRMSEALANRFVHLAIVPDLDDWTRWAISADVRPELIAFVRFRPELLHSYDPKSTEKAYPSPRSWEFVSQMLNASPPASIEHALYAGTVGEGPAGELIGFLDVYRQLPSIDGILMNPKKAAVPEEPGALFAVSAALARKSTEANFDRVMTYADRMPPEWMVYCVKDATARDQRLCDTTAFIKFAADHSDIMG
jgi:hypothetical protein